MTPPRLFALATAVAALSLAPLLPASAADKPIELKTKPYPLDVCAVSGEKLDSMGDPYVFKVGNQEIQLCCKSCEKDFKKDEAAQMKKVADAWKKVKTYPLHTCIASDEELDPKDAVGLVHEGREFVFCCKNCVKEFKKDPSKFVKKFDAAAAKKKS